MNNYAKLYWLTRLDNLNTLFTVAAVLSGILLIAHIMFSYLEDGEAPKKKIVLPVSILMSVMILLRVFTPTKNDYILIMAGGKTLDYVQSDTSLSKIPAQTTAIISQYLDNALKEMKASK